MDDVEQQIKAWADATAPATDGGAPAPAVIPVHGRLGRARWLAAAAAVVVLGAIGVGLAIRSDDDGPELLRASDPPATTATSQAPETTTTAAVRSGSVVGFEVLGDGAATDAEIGSLASAQTPEELSALWRRSMRDLPEPEVDLDRQVVVSLTIDAEECPGTLIGFKREDASITPRFLIPGDQCEQPILPTTYVVASDWASVGDEFTFILRTEVDGDDQEDTLVVTRRDPGATTTSTAAPLATTTTTVPPATTTTTASSSPADLTAQLDLPTTTVASDGEIAGDVVVVNDTGKPIVVTTCGGYFLARLANDAYTQEVVRPGCASSYTIPEGRSTHPVQVMARYGTCTTNPTQPDHRACDADGSLPGLPPGRYQLTIVDDQHAVPAIAPVTITVT